eukprot:SAG31_NODE_303_length_18065_cov_5.733107_4_plen_45_part_00
MNRLYKPFGCATGIALLSCSAIDKPVFESLGGAAVTNIVLCHEY